MGVISGNMLVDGRERDESFQRKTGYVMQQDIHLETSTVREALEFSAIFFAQSINHHPCFFSDSIGSFYSPKAAVQSISGTSAVTQRYFSTILLATGHQSALQARIRLNTCSKLLVQPLVLILPSIGLLYGKKAQNITTCRRSSRSYAIFPASLRP
jgi:hypothetical protein